MTEPSDIAKKWEPLIRIRASTIQDLLNEATAELREQLAEARALAEFTTKGSFEASQVMAKENAHLREQLTKANADLAITVGTLENERAERDALWTAALQFVGRSTLERALKTSNP